MDSGLSDYSPMNGGEAQFGICGALASRFQAIAAHQVLPPALLELAGRDAEDGGSVGYGIAYCNRAEVGKELHTQWA